MALSKEQLQIKRKITQKQNELKEKLFVEVKQLLEDYMTTSAYQQLLIKQIKNIQKEAGSGKLILYIDPADSDKLSRSQPELLLPFLNIPLWAAQEPFFRIATS